MRLVDGLDGARDARRSLRSRMRSSTSTAPLATSSTATSSRPRARAVRGVAADTRPDHDGLEGARLVPRRARRDPVRLERQRRPDGLVGRTRRRRLEPAARRRDRARAARGPRRGDARAAIGRSRPPSDAGSETSASRPAPPFQRGLAEERPAETDAAAAGGRLQGFARGGIRSCGSHRCAGRSAPRRKDLLRDHQPLDLPLPS